MDKRVKHIFNEMEHDYDNVVDLWYSWIFSRLHFFIAKDIISKWNTNEIYKVLDIGCGTGYQSILFSQAGCDVIGIDISDKLIDVAKSKKINTNNFILFEPQFKFVETYNNKIFQYLSKFKDLDVKKPEYYIEDAVSISQENSSFDYINCCGSTLSFIQEHHLALKEINRCLKLSGTFIIEVESKRNFDLIWTLLDSTIFFGKLGFETTFKEAISLMFKNRNKHVNVEYPFGETKNPVYMNIKLFSKKKLIQELECFGLKVEKTYSIHSISNLIPSTILDTEKPSKLLVGLFNLLAKIESLIGYKLPGCSLVLIGKKVKEISE